MRFFLLPVLIVSACFSRGAPLERDLGLGLIYYRAQTVPADLPSNAPAANRSYVLDLRYAQTDSTGSDALTTWLKSRASSKTPVFILANAQTADGLLRLLSRRPSNEGVVVLGAESPGFTPDIAIKTFPETERRAFDAFATQTDTESLLKENASKIRNDEARLSREHVPGGASDYDRPPPPPALDDKSGIPPIPSAPSIDYVLQRALHLHRALLALKKI